MNGQTQMLADTANRLFSAALAHASTQVHADATLDAGRWAQVSGLGLPMLLVPESAGGIGGSWQDARVVMQAMGRHAVAMPLGETMLAANLLATVGLEIPQGSPLSLAVRICGSLTQTNTGARFSGQLAGVPWGAQVSGIVALIEADEIATLMLLNPADASETRNGKTPAGEPRDVLRFNEAPVRVSEAYGLDSRRLLEDCVLLRLGQMSGALNAALALSVDYARNRKQFGKPIGQFQSVQHALAVMGSEVAAVDCAVGAAFRAADAAAEIGDAGFEIACARLRANQAIEIGVATAHQVHGAIGFTHEYALRRFTQRLIGWRSEYGSDREWAAWLGEKIAARGAENFWADLTARDDAIGVPPDETVEEL
ncbi:MAG: acyl-CoA dehydrogenase family protein [Panacagrimonas sp.]